MGENFLVFLILLLLVGIFTHEPFIFVILYLFIGAFLFSFWWLRRTVEKVEMERDYPEKAFVGEHIPIQIKLHNRARLPAVYLQLEDQSPPELSGARLAQQVISLRGGEHGAIQYELVTHKRGLYEIGPVTLASGDLLGLVEEKKKQLPPHPITVYPRVRSLQQLGLPSQAPLGTLRHTSPIFEDPSQPIGKRGYQPGDPMQRIDWKATASSGKLQTKIYQPSIDLNTYIFLDLDRRSYPNRSRYQANEFAIVVTASLANWVISQKQSVGLVSNGHDPYASQQNLHELPAQKGQTQLMNILELLARIDAAEQQPLIPMIQHSAGKFSWGATLLVVTGHTDLSLFEALLPLKKRGLNPIVIRCGEGRDEGKAYASAIRIPYYALRHEMELDHLWRTA